MNQQAINVIAKSIADCVFAKRNNSCTKVCDTSCNRFVKLDVCYSNASIPDQLLIEQQVQDYIIVLENNERLINRNRKQKRIIRIIALVFILIALMLFPTEAAAESRMDYYQNDSVIVNTLKRTLNNIKDTDGNNRITCIDYAVTFKRQWDKYYNPKLCEIVRNYNIYTLWHHLFVMVNRTEHVINSWLFIEPTGSAYNYKMSDYWGETYNPIFNIHGETEYWLNWRE